MAPSTPSIEPDIGTVGRLCNDASKDCEPFVDKACAQKQKIEDPNGSDNYFFAAISGYIAGQQGTVLKQWQLVKNRGRFEKEAVQESKTVEQYQTKFRERIGGNLGAVLTIDQEKTADKIGNHQRNLDIAYRAATKMVATSSHD